MTIMLPSANFGASETASTHVPTIREIPEEKGGVNANVLRDDGRTFS
jgi:hypothetical protein